MNWRTRRSTALRRSAIMERLRLQTGANLVEFALVLPLLLILVFGIIDFGLLMFNKVVITNAAREGARAGVVYHVTFDAGGNPTSARLSDAQIEQVVSDYCARYLVTFGTEALGIDLIPETAERKSGELFTVQVDYPYEYVVLSKLIPTLGGVTLNATSVMRFE